VIPAPDQPTVKRRRSSRWKCDPLEAPRLLDIEQDKYFIAPPAEGWHEQRYDLVVARTATDRSAVPQQRDAAHVPARHDVRWRRRRRRALGFFIDGNGNGQLDDANTLDRDEGAGGGIDKVVLMQISAGGKYTAQVPTTAGNLYASRGSRT